MKIVQNTQQVKQKKQKVEQTPKQNKQNKQNKSYEAIKLWHTNQLLSNQLERRIVQKWHYLFAFNN